MSKPLFSIGMIVKNEMRCIEKCLQALQPLRDAFPCELVIADTGSTDGTREIAEHYADILLDFPWVNDFSAARNAVLERCSGKWHITVDADEYLDPDLTGFRLLAEGKATVPLCCVIQRNYFHPDFARGDYADFYAGRVFSLEHGMRYVGSIHEMVCLPGNEQPEYVLVPQIILHHDGYAHQSLESIRKKELRNLDLLEQELEQEPQDTRRLLQCVESSVSFPERSVLFATRAMELLQNKEEFTDMESVLAARCCMVAFRNHLPQAGSWYRWCAQRFPESKHLQLDATMDCVFMLYGDKQYEAILNLAPIYLKAVMEEQASKVLNEFAIMSHFWGLRKPHQQKFLRIYAESLVHMGRKEDALQKLSGWELETLDADGVRAWLEGMAFVGGLPAAQSELVRLVKTLKEDGSERQAERMKAFEYVAHKCFDPAAEEKTKDMEAPWRLFLQMDDHVFGPAAHLMAAQTAEEIEVQLAKVNDWDRMPAGALARAFAMGARFPDSLWQSGYSVMRDAAMRLSEQDKAFPAHVQAYLAQEEVEYTLAQTRFELMLLQAAFEKPETFEEPALAAELWDGFTSRSAAYVQFVYSPALLNSPGSWCALPAFEQFMLCALTAAGLRADGDFGGYANALRAGLAAAPAMKELVRFLLAQLENSAPSAELLALAEQVRGILAAYAPDDPAVLQLKKSPAYQQVAHLLET